MKILFLDFDGVLHPYAQGMETEKFTRLPLLEEMLRADNDVHIVVTSTWREAYSLDALRNRFSPDLRERIIGRTPSLEEYHSDFMRAEEIEAWLAGVEHGDTWAAVDDDPQNFPPRMKPRVVFTESAVGLTDGNIAALRKLLA